MLAGKYRNLGGKTDPIVSDRFAQVIQSVRRDSGFRDCVREHRGSPNHLSMPSKS